MIKRIMAFILISLASYVVMAIGVLQEYPALLYIGIAVGGALALGLVVWLARMLAKFMGWALTSVLYLTTALSIVGLLAWYDIIPAIAGYLTGIVLSGALCLVFVRRLARWAQKSLIGGEVFSFVSNYQLKSFIQNDRLVDRDTAVTYNVDYKNMVIVLRSLDYSKAEAKDAANHVIAEKSPDIPFDDKIKEALRYLSGQDTVEVYGDRRN